jgi:hypothetical protein
MHHYSRRYRDRFPTGNRQNRPVLLQHSPRALCHQGTLCDAMGRAGLTKTEADDLLDWLEASGCRHYEVSSFSGKSFAVRWWS